MTRSEKSSDNIDDPGNAETEQVHSKEEVTTPVGEGKPRVSETISADFEHRLAANLQQLLVVTLKEAEKFDGQKDPVQWLRNFNRVAKFNRQDEEQS